MTRTVCTISAMNKLEALAALELLKKQIESYDQKGWISEYVIVEESEEDKDYDKRPFPLHFRKRKLTYG